MHSSEQTMSAQLASELRVRGMCSLLILTFTFQGFSGAPRYPKPPLGSILLLVGRYALQCTVWPICPQRETLPQVHIGDLLNVEDVVRAAQGVD